LENPGNIGKHVIGPAHLHSAAHPHAWTSPRPLPLPFGISPKPARWKFVQRGPMRAPECRCPTAPLRAGCRRPYCDRAAPRFATPRARPPYPCEGSTLRQSPTSLLCISTPPHSVSSTLSPHRAAPICRVKPPGATIFGCHHRPEGAPPSSPESMVVESSSRPATDRPGYVSSSLLTRASGNSPTPPSSPRASPRHHAAHLPLRQL
jgi:hypothetical protein